MGIAQLTLSSLLQGFSAFNRKPLAQPPTAGPLTLRTLRKVRPTTERPLVKSRPVSSICSPHPATLRVVRVCDTPLQPGDMGRLVISGRMADVCAELDRLVAQEAALQTRNAWH